MATKVLALRRDDECSICTCRLAAGTNAQWDSTARTVTCLAGAAADKGGAPIVGGSATAPPVLEPVPEIDVGRPGVSARKEHERRHAKREQQIEQKWGTGRLGRMAKFLSDDPQTTRAWAQ